MLIMETPQSTKKHLSNALLSFLYNFFIYFLFLVPLQLWKKAVIRLSAQKQKGNLSISKISSIWPFFSFLKAYFFEFLIDGFILIGYIIGPVYTIYTTYLAYKSVHQGSYLNSSGESIEIIFETFLWGLIYTYYSPIGLSLVRDIIQFILLPIQKFINWVSKPAQYMDFTILDKSKEQNISNPFQSNFEVSALKNNIDANDL